ncbi:MAG: DUF433 domain-containing protein [Bacteroidota bacterium]|nr:DUF433 domain-containing protein [Bacteroidota bacterium]
MNHKERIVCDPNVMLGKPIVKSTRITVEVILRKTIFLLLSIMPLLY